MAPPSWANEAQTGLLNNYLPLYETYHASTKRYQPFWDTINAAYLQEFPFLPDGVNPKSLDEAEFALYSKKLAKLYSVRQVPVRCALSIITQLALSVSKNGTAGEPTVEVETQATPLRQGR